MNNILKLPKNDRLALAIFKKQIKSNFRADQPKLVLFGSKARGDFKKDSDLDLLVVFKKTTLKKKNLIADLTTELFLKYGADLSPHTYSLKEFQSLSRLETPFALAVKKEGISL